MIEEKRFQHGVHRDHGALRNDAEEFISSTRQAVGTIGGRGKKNLVPSCKSFGDSEFSFPFSHSTKNKIFCVLRLYRGRV